MDAGFGGDGSLAHVDALRHLAPDARVVMMDIAPASEAVAALVNAGVAGFVLKDATFDEFVATVRAVAGGAKVLPPRMTESLFTQIAREAGARQQAVVPDDVRMTRREREVIALIGDGLSNKEIAERLGIATHTVKSHVRNLMEKLALHTRLQIAAYSHHGKPPRDRTP